EMKGYLAYFEEPQNHEKLDPITRAIFEKYLTESKRMQKIPPELNAEYNRIVARSPAVWLEAKKSNDFEAFRPIFEQVVDYNRRFLDFWGYENEPYDALLTYTEPGLNTEKLDAVFARLRERLVPL